MEFFGISSAKLILIFVIAIVLLGPDQVPQMVKTVGKFIRDFRRWTNEMNKEFNEATGDLRKEFNDTVSGLRDEIEQTQTDLRSQLNPLTEVFRDPLGTMTAQTPEPIPVAAPAFAAPVAAVPALSNEANPLAVQTPTYTPPESVTYTAPETAVSPTGVPFGFDGTNGGYTNGANGVTDAGATNGTYTNGVSNGYTAPPRATKADPFADLVALAPAPAPAVTTVTAEPFATFGDFTAFTTPTPLEPIPTVAVESVPEPTPEAVSVATPVALAEPVALTPRPASIGRSVAGTKYGRKRAS